MPSFFHSASEDPRNIEIRELVDDCSRNLSVENKALLYKSLVSAKAGVTHLLEARISLESIVCGVRNSNNFNILTYIDENNAKVIAFFLDQKFRGGLLSVSSFLDESTLQNMSTLAKHWDIKNKSDNQELQTAYDQFEQIHIDYVSQNVREFFEKKVEEIPPTRTLSH